MINSKRRRSKKKKKSKGAYRGNVVSVQRSHGSVAAKVEILDGSHELGDVGNQLRILQDVEQIRLEII